MLICPGILSSSNGVWGRLVNCVFSLYALWEFDFFVQSRFKHILVKPWMLYVLIRCNEKTLWTCWHTLFTTAPSWKSSERDALTHRCVLLAQFLAPAISTSVFALGFMNVKMVHSCLSRWLTRPAFWPLTQWKQPGGMPFQHSRTSGWVSFTREISLTLENKTPAFTAGAVLKDTMLLVPGALFFTCWLSAHHLCT